MKKVFILLLLILIFPVFVNAASGCCSHHGGVDCTRIQSNGKVVCNDGWKGSSCSYSGMKKCIGYNPVSSSKTNKNKVVTNKKNTTTKENSSNSIADKSVPLTKNEDVINNDIDDDVVKQDEPDVKKEEVIENKVEEKTTDVVLDENVSYVKADSNDNKEDNITKETDNSTKYTASVASTLTDENDDDFFTGLVIIASIGGIVYFKNKKEKTI